MWIFQGAVLGAGLQCTVHNTVWVAEHPLQGVDIGFYLKTMSKVSAYIAKHEKIYFLYPNRANAYVAPTHYTGQ
jgi:hypothetical protein